MAVILIDAPHYQENSSRWATRYSDDDCANTINVFNVDYFQREVKVDFALRRGVMPDRRCPESCGISVTVHRRSGRSLNVRGPRRRATVNVSSAPRAGTL